jgi:hypothetical protein
MPLFEVTHDALIPFRQVRPGADLYESEIEGLAWADLEAFTGESLFPIARQATLPGGGRPDLLAMDESGRVVIIEVKRDVDRSQLAQCLEYAGWARTTGLDELAGLYHGGPEAFFTDWQDFTDSTTPVVVNRSPRLVLIARDFQVRTRSALDFLRENGLPVTVIPVAIYEDEQHRRFLDIEAEHEPSLGIAIDSGGTHGPTQVKYQGRRVLVADLIDAGLVEPGEELVFPRPRLGQEFRAVVLANGSIQTGDGAIHASPSLAAMRTADVPSYDGWHAWRVPRLNGVKLDVLRKRLVADAEITST